jgi:hypothetical protein
MSDFVPGLFAFADTKSEEYFLSTVAGLAIIALFARKRLNTRVSEGDNSIRQKWFVDLLEPSKLTRRRIYLQAWLLYFCLLVILYSIVLLLAEPFLTIATAIGGESVGFSSTQPKNPIVPLIASLVLTGLIPQVFPISQIEEAVRDLSLKTVGIPQCFNDLTDALFDEEIPNPPLQQSDREEIERIAALALRTPRILRN